MSLENYKDFTLKARLTNSKNVEGILKRIKAEFIGIDSQEDHYFKVPNGKLKWRKGTIENVIAHYERVSDAGIERTRVYWYEKNPGKDQINTLLKQYSRIGVVEKTRKIYTIEHIKIHIDELPNGEVFLEIEAIDHHNRFSGEELKKQCHHVRQQLNIPIKSLIKTGYMSTPTTYDDN